MKVIRAVLVGAFIVLLSIVAVYTQNTVFGSTNGSNENIDTEVLEKTIDTENVSESEEELKEVEDKITKSKENMSDITNILLIGEENMDKNKRGRSDSIIIVSINKKTNSVKMISLLRDMLVDIEGHDKNKLNSAYAFGGVDLLKDTIEKNFLIDIDYYAKVDFSTFESIVDVLGGVDIELTEEESNYLNITNYISNEEYRTTVPGINHFNGNQALGYSRVRYVPAINGELYDFGRTFRQRTLISSIYSKLKDQNLVTLVKVFGNVFNNLDTDISYMDALSFVSILKDLDFEDIHMYRIPVDGSYQDSTYNKMSVLIFDKSNIEQLKNYILE